MAAGALEGTESPAERPEYPRERAERAGEVTWDAPQRAEHAGEATWRAPERAVVA